MSKITIEDLTNLVWHGMLYSSCTHMATVGVRGLYFRGLYFVYLFQ